MNKTDKILILGSRGLVGTAIVDELRAQGYGQLLTPARSELDLLDQKRTVDYFEACKPDFVFLAAAKVGGILANDTYRADFIFENLQIQQNVFNAAFKASVQNLMFLGSSCIYPKSSPQPIHEEHLLTASLEETNEPYAVAKIAGLKSVESFRRQYGLNWISLMPTNVYGLNDNFDLNNSHVIPGLIARMGEAVRKKAKSFSIWGSGRPRREFIFSTDLARACVHVMGVKENVPDFMNVGTGEDIEIGELARLIARKMNFEGELIFDSTKPDGTMRKLLDSSRIMKLGWKPSVSLDEGLERVVASYWDRRKEN